MRRGIILSAILVLVVFIVGCIQEEGEQTLSCDAYCAELPHIQCIGYWSVSGDYPNCGCAWICSESGASDVVSEGVCAPDWSCTDWTICTMDNTQSRICGDLGECNTTDDKPIESQACVYENICEAVSDTAIKSSCSVLLLEDSSECLEDSYEGCIYDLAKVNLNVSLCEEINTSFNRNSCKAILNNDKAYCDILEPSLRDNCYDTVYNYLSRRGTIENDYSYCDLIDSVSMNGTCMQKINNSEHFNHLTNHSICEHFAFDYNETLNNDTYQEIYSCYAYHAVNDNASPCESIKNVVNLTDSMYDECTSLRSNDLTYCYQFNSTKRDKCYAHFAYKRNDTLVCRDAYDRDECLNLAGTYFGQIHFCEEINSDSLRNSCIYTVAALCLRYNWKDCNSEYCRLITDNNGLRDACILNVVEHDKESEFIFKRFI